VGAGGPPGPVAAALGHRPRRLGLERCDGSGGVSREGSG
jgi:hypothetical protein